MDISEALSKDLPGVIAITLGCSIAIILPVTYMITSNWRKIRQHEQNAVLKKVMLDRGMPAAEIEAIVNAGSGHDVWENEEAVKTMKYMIKKGYQAEDIAKVMQQGPSAADKIKAI